MNLLQLLMGAMTSQSSVGSVSGKTGLSNKQVQQLMLLAIPLLLKYMTKNASSGNGAQSLLGALAQHTDQKNMDKQIDDADEEDGSKIISHILGSLAILAPAMMSGVSQAASSASASNEPARPAGPSLSGLMGSGIFGSLLGLGKKEKEDDDPEFNGTALLQALLGAKK